MRFHAAFTPCEALQLPPDRTDCEHAWHLYMLRLHLDRLSIDRAQFMEELKARHIGASVHFIPLHIHPYYRGHFGYAPDAFPVAYREYLREVSLPIYSRMSDDDVQRVIDAVIDIARTYKR
jgi:dTDP-4-amino-4,6-dideoxygalactose transaminase